MSSIHYIRKYAYYYLYAISLTLLVIYPLSSAVTQTAAKSDSINTVIVIDPGHGGADGGTTSSDGVLESDLNLEIAFRLRDAFRLLGYDTVLLRADKAGLETEGATIRERKISDLKNRVKSANAYANGLLISIHQNHFPQNKYFGPQVFFSDNQQAQELSVQLQRELNRICVPLSRRQSKPSDGVYLMERLRIPGVLVECGFLSNPAEANLLQEVEYQIRLAGVISATTATSLHNGIRA